MEKVNTTQTHFSMGNFLVIMAQVCNSIRASLREILSSGVCEQHRRRSACASAQSDQRLCNSLSGKYHMYTCYRRNFNSLASLCSWGDWFETCLVGNPKDRFSRDVAHTVESGKFKVQWTRDFISKYQKF